MIINRYLIREISRPLVVILSILVALFASYSAADFLSDAVNGLVPTDTIAAMVGLKALISLEVLIPISLYISVLLAFGKLYRDSEFTAMFALRVTPLRIMGAVLTLSGCLAVIVAGLSLFERPWSYRTLHALARRAELSINVNNMEAGTFYVSEHGRRVIFFAHRDGPKSPAKNVFVRLRDNNRIRVIYSPQAFQIQGPGNGDDSEVYMSDSRLYGIGLKKDGADSVVDAQGIILNPANPTMDAPEYSSVGAGTAQIATSDKPTDIAEFQWRLSTPLSTLLLGLMAVPLSRSKPRQSRYAKTGTAILIYSGYYLLCTSARTWVQHGVVPSFPGIWWVPTLLALIFLFAEYQPVMGFELRRIRDQFEVLRMRWRGASSNISGGP